MEELQSPSKSEVLKAFKQADDNGKKLLQSLFGKIEPENITDRIKTFEDACDALGIDCTGMLRSSDCSFLTEHLPSINAYCKLIVITAALNEGWKPDWDDEDEYKYYPWFYMRSASGFRLSRVDYCYDGSYVGSRLCFQKSEVAEYAAKQFCDIYKEFMTL
jgi:hypothetical protein